jgi:hypothetical protein
MSHAQIGDHVAGAAGGDERRPPLLGITMPALIQINIEELDLPVISVQQAAASRPLVAGQHRAEQVQGVLGRVMNARRVAARGAKMQIQGYRAGKGVAPVTVHGVHDLALEVSRRRFVVALPPGLALHLHDQRSPPPAAPQQ